LAVCESPINNAFLPLMSLIVSNDIGATIRWGVGVVTTLVATFGVSTCGSGFVWLVLETAQPNTRIYMCGFSYIRINFAWPVEQA
jgi:hypothetical protein